jgi:hypothetical protein
VPDWVLAAERAYVAAAVGRPDPEVAAATARTASTPRVHPGEASASDRAFAAAGAVASRHLAVAAPRSFGIVIDVATQVDAAALSLVAHQTWFAPHDIRCAAIGAGAEDLAAATGGRVVPVAEALACDIVTVHAAYARLTPDSLRRGTHVNILWAGVLDPELYRLARVTREPDLPALAAGLIDGRQLDEITIFVIGGAAIAAAVV